MTNSGKGPRWSVVIPAFNAAGTIRDQLDALVPQMPEDGWELVVADNGSTDATVEVVRAYADRVPTLTVADASDRRGASHTRNVGAAHARGDVLVFVDADDVVAPGWFAALSARIDDAGLVGGNIDLDRLAAPDGVVTEPSWQDLPRLLELLPWAITANLAVHRSAFEDVGGFDTSFPRGEDVAFSWRVQLAGHRIAFAPDAVVWYRTRTDLRSLWRQQVGNGELVPHLYKAFRVHGARRDPLLRVARYYVWLLTRLPGALVSRAARHAWIERAGIMVGRLRGSIRHRVFCP